MKFDDVTWMLLLCLCHSFLLISAQESDGDDAVDPATEVVIYNRHSLPCIMMRINATIAIEPKLTNNKKHFVEVPRHADAGGKCDTGINSQLLMTWDDSFRLNWHFQKSNVSDAWYVDHISFSYNTTEKILNEEGNAEVQEIHSPESFTLWLTPTRHAYSCRITQNIKLLDFKNQRRVTIRLRQIKVQPFASMVRHQYGNSFICSNDSIPIETSTGNDTRIIGAKWQYLVMVIAHFSITHSWMSSVGARIIPFSLLGIF